MQRVKSSNVHSVSHDPATSTLRVKFHSGSVWEYDDVSAAEHAALLAADSIGSHFHRAIKSTKQGRQVS